MAKVQRDCVEEEVGQGLCYNRALCSGRVEVSMKTYRIVLTVVASVLLVVSRADAQRGLADTIVERPPVAETPAEETDTTLPSDPAAALRAKVSQLMIVALEGSNNTTTGDRFLLERYTPGGVVLTRLTQPQDAIAYIGEIRRIAEPRGLPLFIGTDLYSLVTQERNPKAMFIQLPSPLSVAAADHPESVSRVAELLAKHMTAMGFNLHIGPSLELTSTLTDVKGSIYRFGSDPELTARAGATIVKTLSEHGVLTMPMGFPGGGANRRGNGPAVLLTPPTVLASEDARPYIEAIAAGAKLIHVAPTLAPMLDNANIPSCLSAKVMRDLLRDRLKFEGLIVAGPVDGPDVVRDYDAAEAAILALGAGADMLYWSTSRQTMVRAVDMIVQAVATGRLAESVIDTAYERVKTMKGEHAELTKALPKEKVAADLGRKKAFPEETYRVERYAITLVQNRGNVLPLNKDASMPMGVTGVLGVEELHDALEEYIKPISQQQITTAKHAGRIHGFEIDRLTRHIRGIRTIVVILNDDIPSASQVELIEGLQAKGVKVVVVLLGYPKNLEALAVADAVLLTYANEITFAQSLRAVADALVGLAPINIYPGVRPLHTQVGKAERFNVYDLIRSPSGRLPVTIGPFPSGTAVSYDSAPNLKRVEWDFGDGKRSKSAETEHAYEKPGHYNVTLTVTEKGGASVSRQFEVIVE